MEEFRSQLRRLAEEEAKRIIDDAEEESKRILKKADDEVKRAMERRLQETRIKLAEKERIELASARIEARRRVLSVKSKYLDQVFKEAENRLKEIPTQEPSIYQKVLVNYIMEALENLEGKEFMIQMNRQDQPLANKTLYLAEDALKKSGKNVKLKISPVPMDASGGVIVYTEDMRQYYVNTFESKLTKTRSESQGKIMEILLRSE
ncbi:MAG: V-type ATP synthase subunit E [Nitrososphaeria archaeon]